MKKIVIIDGGPRRNMNTAQMLQKFAEGVNSANEEILMLDGEWLAIRRLLFDVRI